MMNDKQNELFTQLISSLHAAALMQMGRIKNPATNAVEKHLDQAGVTIDMLEMLKETMKGNLTPEQEKFFAAVLSEVRLSFVNETTKGSS